jgi:hypothetical protein
MALALGWDCISINRAFGGASRGPLCFMCFPATLDLVVEKSMPRALINIVLSGLVIEFVEMNR